MDADRFGEFLARSIERGGPPLNMSQVPQGIKDQIVHMVLMSPHLDRMLQTSAPRFEFDVNENDEICRVEWERDGSRTISLIADGTWFSVYQTEEGRTSVFRCAEDHYLGKDVDTETMEAVMMIAGVHPTQNVG